RAGHVTGVQTCALPICSPAARSALGWIPQELALYPRLTCRENLRSFGRYHGLRGAALEEAVARCLGWATLNDRAGELVRNLSGGDRKSVVKGKGGEPGG